MNVQFHDDAEAEFLAAVLWYESQTPGAGQALHDAVMHGVSQIREHPDAWAVWPRLRLTPTVRRYVIERFPYVLPFAFSRALMRYCR